jgi:aspartate racemase
MVRIGVLGGIGPEATGEFYIKLIRRMQERKLVKSNKDYPQIIINSIPAPELPVEAYNISISVKDMDPLYLDGLIELDEIGVDFIVMVCNTIHLFYDELQKSISTPILNLKEEMRKTLVSKGIKSVTVLGTPWTIKMGLYRFEGIKEIHPTEDEIKKVYSAIYNFNRGFDKQTQIETVRKICEKSLERGAEVVILGCTELAVMLNGENIPTINSIDVLVEATVNNFCHLRGKS